MFFLVLLSEVLIQAVPVDFAASPTTSKTYEGVFVPIPNLEFVISQNKSSVPYNYSEPLPYNT